MKAVNVGKGALNSLPQYVADYGYSKPYVLCDEITYQAAGAKCAQLLRDAGFETAVLVIKHTGFDEATLGEIVINTPDDCDLMIGCGTGAITSILRYASFKLKLPCFTVCTAAPMDGFSASVGIMNVNNLKATMPAHSTEVIIGDTDILAAAPFRMTIAGFGDLISKLNALNDWRIGVIVNGDHFCEKIYDLIRYYVNDMLEKAPGLKTREPEVIGDVMNALLLTGTTISLYGNSRPVSGAEHHLSHYWEVLGEQRGKPFAMHGEQAAVGTVLGLMLEEKLSGLDVDFDEARTKAKAYSPDGWKKEICRVYGNAADAILKLEKTSGKNAVGGRLQRIAVAEERWTDVQEVLRSAYPWKKLRALLREISCPCDPRDIGITADVLKDSLLYSKDTRARYTAAQLAWDLGVIEQVADEMIAELREMGAVE